MRKKWPAEICTWITFESMRQLRVRLQSVYHFKCLVAGAAFFFIERVHNLFDIFVSHMTL